MVKKSSQFALVKQLFSFGLQLTPVLPARHAILSFPPTTHDSHKYRQLTITAFALFAWFSTETISTFAAGRLGFTRRSGKSVASDPYLYPCTAAYWDKPVLKSSWISVVNVLYYISRVRKREKHKENGRRERCQSSRYDAAQNPKGVQVPRHETIKKNISTRETLRTLSCTLQSSTPAFSNALLVVWSCTWKHRSVTRSGRRWFLLLQPQTRWKGRTRRGESRSAVVGFLWNSSSSCCRLSCCL